MDLSFDFLRHLILFIHASSHNTHPHIPHIYLSILSLIELECHSPDIQLTTTTNDNSNQPRAFDELEGDHWEETLVRNAIIQVALKPHRLVQLSDSQRTHFHSVTKSGQHSQERHHIRFHIVVHSYIYKYTPPCPAHAIKNISEIASQQNANYFKEYLAMTTTKVYNMKFRSSGLKPEGS